VSDTTMLKAVPVPTTQKSPFFISTVDFLYD
jgi:hypothetical protein